MIVFECRSLLESPDTHLCIIIIISISSSSSIITIIAVIIIIIIVVIIVIIITTFGMLAIIIIIIIIALISPLQGDAWRRDQVKGPEGLRRLYYTVSYEFMA